MTIRLEEFIDIDLSLEDNPVLVLGKRALGCAVRYEAPRPVIGLELQIARAACFDWLNTWLRAKNLAYGTSLKVFALVVTSSLEAPNARSSRLRYEKGTRADPSVVEVAIWPNDNQGAWNAIAARHINLLDADQGWGVLQESLFGVICDESEIKRVVKLLQHAPSSDAAGRSQGATSRHFDLIRDIGSLLLVQGNFDDPYVGLVVIRSDEDRDS